MVRLRHFRMRQNMEFWSEPGFKGEDILHPGIGVGEVVTVVGEFGKISKMDCHGWVGPDDEYLWTARIIFGDTVGYLTGDEKPEDWMWEVLPSVHDDET